MTVGAIGQDGNLRNVQDGSSRQLVRRALMGSSVPDRRQSLRNPHLIAADTRRIDLR